MRYTFLDVTNRDMITVGVSDEKGKTTTYATREEADAVLDKFVKFWGGNTAGVVVAIPDLDASGRPINHYKKVITGLRSIIENAELNLVDKSALTDILTDIIKI